MTMKPHRASSKNLASNTAIADGNRSATAHGAVQAPIRKLRCAVYTRKSSEEGLDMEFNSLEAQREACEAYIVSQRAEGWTLVPDRYDDGGISGGTLERPALHLFDAGSEVTKYTWSKTDKPIIDQIRAALDDEKYPLFVSEGTSLSKWERILHAAYLHKAHRSFESCCSSSGNAIIIYGHSLDDNDDHVLRCIPNGNCGWLLVSLFGEPDTPANQKIIAKVEKFVGLRGPTKGRRVALDVFYYEAASAKVWG